MTKLLTCVALVALAMVSLLPRSAALTSLATEYEVEIGRLDGIKDVAELDHPDLTRARAVVASIDGDPLPELKRLAMALTKEFGSAEILDGDYYYIWVVDPETGVLMKFCIERDRVVVAPDDDTNPIVVDLVTRVLLD